MGSARIWTWDLLHLKQESYHWATGYKEPLVNVKIQCYLQVIFWGSGRNIVKISMAAVEEETGALNQPI